MSNEAELENLKNTIDELRGMIGVSQGMNELLPADVKLDKIVAALDAVVSVLESR